MSDLVRKGAELELTIEKLAFGGKALARIDNFVVFVDRALPGQKVRVRIRRKKSHYAEAQCLQVLSQADHYVPAFCPHFGVCGGCSWQDLPYEQQLVWKQLHVIECLEHLAGLDVAKVEPVLSAPQTTFYRNKMEYTFSDRAWLSAEEIAAKEISYNRSFALGLHVRGAFDKILNIRTCFLQSRRSVEVLNEARAWCERSGMPSYTTRDHQGFWRFLIIREGKHTSQMLVHVLTAPHPEQDRVVTSLSDHLLLRFPEITTVVHSVSQKKAQVAVGEASHIIHGPGFIEERLGGMRFQISAHSFFQTNSYGAEELTRTIIRLGDFSGQETVWDLYCGTGSIAICVAPYVQRVVGFEVVEQAVEDANRNRELNGIDNCFFAVGDLNEMTRDLDWVVRHGGLPDVIITDPPRAGMHPRVVRALLEISPQRIIVVSCNPSTLARDLGMLGEDYAITAIQPVDMFPHTPHIECVVGLEKRHR